MVRITRKMIAATEPQMMACFCWWAGSERAASAITTALSPDNRMLTTMIWPSPIQNTGLETYSIMLVAPRGSLLCFRAIRSLLARKGQNYTRGAPQRHDDNARDENFVPS